MSTIAEQLTQLETAKQSIKTAIINKGVAMDNVPFTSYAAKIAEIQTGGGLPALTDGYVVRWEREDQLYEITNVKQGNAVNAPATSPVVGQTINWYDYYHQITFPYTPSADVVLTAYTDTEFNNTYYVIPSNYSQCAVQTQQMFQAWFDYVNNGHADDGKFVELVISYIGALPLSFLLTSVGESYTRQLPRFMQYASRLAFSMSQLSQITELTQRIRSIVGEDTAPSPTYIDRVKTLLTQAYAVLGIQLIQSGTSVLLLDSSSRILLEFTGLPE